MKYTLPLIVLLLLPIILSGSFLQQTAPRFGTLTGGKFTPARSWRVSSVTQEQYMMNTWGTTNRSDMIYSSQYPTRLDTLKYYGWETDSRQWVLYANFSYVYDNTNEYVTSSYVTMQHEGTWYPFMRSNFTYDSQHRLTHSMTEMYNPQTQVWSTYMWTWINFISPTNYTVWQYQAETENRTQQWMKMEFVWDAQGRIIEETDIVSADSITWVNSEKYVRTYHPHDTTTGEIFISNFSHYMPLQNMLEDAYADDFFGMLSHEMNKYWNGSAWVDTYQSFYTYDNSDRLTQELEQQWMNNAWNNNWQLDFTYDVNGNQFQTVESYYENSILTPYERYTFSWEQTTANADNTTPALSGLQITASPNPFTAELSIQIKSRQSQPALVSIYNLRGQLIRNVSAQTNSKLSWDGTDDMQNQVAQGMYLIKVTSGSETTSAKVLKLR
jgi:YD repeat-containing protein